MLIPSLLQPSSIYTILSFDYIEPVIIERKRAVLPREFQAVLDEFHRTVLSSQSLKTYISNRSPHCKYLHDHRSVSPYLSSL